MGTTKELTKYFIYDLNEVEKKYNMLHRKAVQKEEEKESLCCILQS